MKLIPDWRRAWRLWTVQLTAAAAGMMAIIAALPADLLAAGLTAFPNMPPLLNALLLSVIAAVRLIEQPKENVDDKRT